MSDVVTKDNVLDVIKFLLENGIHVKNKTYGNLFAFSIRRDTDIIAAILGRVITRNTCIIEHILVKNNSLQLKNLIVETARFTFHKLRAKNLLTFAAPAAESITNNVGFIGDKVKILTFDNFIYKQEIENA